MSTARIRVLLMLLCALCVPCVLAESARVLAWEELVVRLPVAENPFARLSMEQLEALIDIAGVRDRKARGMPVSPQDATIEREASTKLEKSGISVDALLAERDKLGNKQRALAEAVNPALDGKLVRMPGYLLPLEYTGKQVTEFLLVPWVGACIHTPPPAPNQIVHVKLDKPFAFKGMYDAVWVTGRLATSTARKSVYITDGSADIDVGYSMRASQVEAY
jgi:uncharacterized protein